MSEKRVDNIKKNDIVTLKITSATAEGSGVGKTEGGIAVFVPQTAVGDEAEVRILKVKKTYAFGKLERIIKPSEHRIEPDCPYFSKCGGCVWRHISYDEECRIKRQRVIDAVERIGGIKTEFAPIIRADSVDRYRNKAQFPVGVGSDGEVKIGFYAFHSHRIIDCDDCALQPRAFARVVEITREFITLTNADIYDEATGRGRLRHIYIRLGEVTGELMVCFVVNGNGLKREDLLIKMLRDRLPEIYILVSTVIARIISACYNYTLNYTKVFHSRARVPTSGSKYALLAVLIMMCSAFFVTCGRAAMPFMPETLIKIAVDIVLFFVSYKVQQKFVYQSHSRKSQSSK